MPEQLIRQLDAEEEAFARALLAIVDEYGKFDDDSEGVWVGYVPASENEDAEIGVKCENCAFRESENVCEIISAQIENEGNCRLAVILPGRVEGYEPEDDEEIESAMIDEQFADGYVPPAGARAEARRGLEWRRQYGRGGTAIGVARARDIANGASLSASTIKRMVSYFARHEVDKKGQGWSPGQDGYPSAGRIAWALWGGDAGRSWANKTARSIDSQAAEEQDSDMAYGRKKAEEENFNA